MHIPACNCHLEKYKRYKRDGVKISIKSVNVIAAKCNNFEISFNGERSDGDGVVLLSLTEVYFGPNRINTLPTH